MIRFLENKKFFLVIFFGVFTLTNVIASSYPFFYRGARQQGMGGAFIGLADDFDALYYNGAGLTLLKKSQFKTIDISLESGIKSIRLGETFDDNTVNNFEALFSAVFAGESNLLSELTNQVGGNSFLNVWVSLFSYAAVWDNFVLAFSPYLRNQSTISINNFFDPRSGISTILDIGIIASMSIKFPLGFSLGGTIRGFSRYEVDTIYTLSQLRDSSFQDDFKKNLNESRKNQAETDVSILWVVPLPYSRVKWQIGASFYNIYKTTDGYRSLNIGTSYKVSLLNEFLFINIVGDFRDINYEIDLDKSLGKRIYVGVELGIHVEHWLQIVVRNGVSQGYPSFGFGLKLAFLTLNYAQYTEEIGAYAGQTGNIRQIFELKTDW